MNNIRLLELRATNFGSIRDESISFQNLNVFIGANGSGKSTILDALRFLQDGLKARDFARAVGRRGGPRYLFGKWERDAGSSLGLLFEDEKNGKKFEWDVEISVSGRRFSVAERATELPSNGSTVDLMTATDGTGWWLTGNGQRVQFKQDPTACALGSAAADVAFPGRAIHSSVVAWRFIDPSLFILRRLRPGDSSDRLDVDGRNLVERLHHLKESDVETFDRIVKSMRSVLGMPEELVPAQDRAGFYHLHFHEKGLLTPVTQNSVSAGTLRILTLMTALHEDPHCGFIGIEEPENNVHPSALRDFMQHLVDASRWVQLLITTHSPMLLDHLDVPESVCVVRRHDDAGTKVVREQNPDGVKAALEASGFGLGEFYETKGFGQ